MNLNQKRLLRGVVSAPVIRQILKDAGMPDVVDHITTTRNECRVSLTWTDTVSTDNKTYATTEANRIASAITKGYDSCGHVRPAFASWSASVVVPRRDTWGL